jgi:hypothetical protein
MPAEVFVFRGDMDHQKFSEDELMGLLFGEEDHLPRAAVDEFIRQKRKKTAEPRSRPW